MLIIYGMAWTVGRLGGHFVRVENCDLLPDLAAETRGQILDVIHGVNNNRIGQVLSVERGELAGERQHLGAIVEVASKLETVHATLGRSLGWRPMVQNDAGVFGELMHIDEVCNRTEDVEIAHRTPPLDSIF